MIVEIFINHEQESTIGCSLKEIHKRVDEFQNYTLMRL
jgi:hypothetical protein